MRLGVEDLKAFVRETILDQFRIVVWMIALPAILLVIAFGVTFAGKTLAWAFWEPEPATAAPPMASVPEKSVVDPRLCDDARQAAADRWNYLVERGGTDQHDPLLAERDAAVRGFCGER